MFHDRSNHRNQRRSVDCGIKVKCKAALCVTSLRPIEFGLSVFDYRHVLWSFTLRYHMDGVKSNNWELGFRISTSILATHY